MKRGMHIPTQEEAKSLNQRVEAIESTKRSFSATLSALKQSASAKVSDTKQSALASAACFRCSWRLTSFLYHGSPKSEKIGAWKDGAVHCKLPDYGRLLTVLRSFENKGHRFNVNRKGEQVQIKFVPDGTPTNVEKCSKAVVEVASGTAYDATCNVLGEQLRPLLEHYPNVKVLQLNPDTWRIKNRDAELALVSENRRYQPRPEKYAESLEPDINNSYY